MTTLYSYFDEKILPLIHLIKFVFYSNSQEQVNSLNNIIVILQSFKNELVDKYDAIKDEVEKNHKDSKQIVILEMIYNDGKKYINLTNELEAFLDGAILNKHHWKKIDKDFVYLIEFIQNLIGHAQSFIHIWRCYHHGTNNIFKQKSKDIYFSSLSSLKIHISTLSEGVKIYFQTNNPRQLLEVEQYESIINELEKIKAKLGKFSYAIENPTKFGTLFDVIEPIAYIFGIAIKQINVDNKCQILLIIGTESYLLNSLVSECKKLEQEVGSIINKATALTDVIYDCLEQVEFLELYQNTYQSNYKSSISSFVDNINEILSNSKNRLNIQNADRLAETLKDISKKYNYLKPVYENITMVLEDHKKNKAYKLSVSKLQGLMKILGLSMYGIGLKSNEYIIYSSKAKSRSLIYIVYELLKLAKKIAPHLVQLEFFMIVGKQCLQHPLLFHPTIQSSLTVQNINKYLIVLERQLKESQKHPKILSIEEAKEKIAKTTSVLERLIKLEQHLENTFNPIYTIGIKYNIISRYYLQVEPAVVHNILSLYNVQELVFYPYEQYAKNFLFVFNKKNRVSYIDISKTFSIEYCQLTSSVKTLLKTAEESLQYLEQYLNPNFHEILQQEKQRIQQQQQKIKQRQLIYRIMQLGLVSLLFLCGVSMIYICRENYFEGNINFDKAQTILLRTSTVKDAKNIEQVYDIKRRHQEIVSIIKNDVNLFNKVLNPKIQVMYDESLQEINNADEKIKSEEFALSQLKIAEKFAREADDLLQNPPVTLEVSNKADEKYYQAKQALLLIPRNTFLQVEIDKKIQEYEDKM
ncbi:hypothetical protein NIES4071_91250 [Calothrix sp. NIES-4071]|nr:hypothetical protein NIES4071_91250 [Calothrix sp. NIES-4071]BAZ63392.1 hypothetical protein NIES4105_91180 [Calothrix sp. NIES-4105]